MSKKTYAVYGNSSHTLDMAMMIGVSFANKGYKTAVVEIGEKNAQLGYQLGVEEQRIKTTDYYLLNHKKEYHINNCLITPGDIAEEFLTDQENAIKRELKKLPSNLSLLIKKAQPEDTILKEDEWQQLITRMKKEIYEEHDILIIATGGRMFSYNVFFPILHADELILVVEDKPEDLRGLNQFVIEIEKIKKDVEVKSIYLNHGININEDDFKQTKLNIVKSIKLKPIQGLKLSTWSCYSTPLKDVDEMVAGLVENRDNKASKSKFKLFTSKKGVS